LRLSHPEPRTARNELRAIKKLCDGGHKNIIKVFDFGDLPDASHVFIDMELCSLNLDEYNKSVRTAFLVHESVSSLRSEQIWDIIIQIADALAFIHGHHEIHRDLKPQNGPCSFEAFLTLPVLYSRIDKMWKVADFGLTSEGTSNSLHNTEYCRGTPGYRAPELLQDGEILYNNKVDIWALGCILYELVVGAKPFVSDLSVLQHYQSGSFLGIQVDETFDADSTLLFPKAIFEMLQYDPVARPTASTLLDNWSMHRQVNNTNPLILIHNDSPITTSEAPSAKISEPLPIFRKFLETPETPPPPPGIDEREWIVFFTIVNTSNTRMATESCDVDHELSRVTLWDAWSGQALWAVQFPWAGVRSRANSTFSSDGEYFGVHHGDKTLEILNAKTATSLTQFDVKFGDGRITAIAITRNGKGMAVAIAETVQQGVLEPSAPAGPRDVASLVTLNDTDQHQPNLDVVQTRRLSHISLAYDPRGRRLFLLGCHGEYQRVGICWDTITKSALMTIPPSQDLVANNWISPLYNAPSTDIFLRGLQSGGTFQLLVFPILNVMNLTAIQFHSYGIFGVKHPYILILTNEEMFDVWDITLSRWRPQHIHTVKDPSDTTSYKYLWKCDGKALDKVGGPTEFSIIAKIAWDNMPPLREIRGLAEKDDGLTLITEDEKFIVLHNCVSIPAGREGRM
jgi:serine/threonine protein kinase